MRTGRFVWRPTGPWRPVMYTNPDGPPKLDYVGLNYYSRCCRVLGTLVRASTIRLAVAGCHCIITHPRGQVCMQVVTASPCAGTTLAKCPYNDAIL